MIARLSPYSAILFVVLGLISSIAIAATPSGTVIQNTAELTYLDTFGTETKVLSIPSQVVVAPYYNFELHDDHAVQSFSGALVSYPHYILNTGNIADAYNVSTVNLFSLTGNGPPSQLQALQSSRSRAKESAALLLSDDDGDFEFLSVYHDQNGNGMADPGEPEITQTTLLAPGERFEIVVQGIVPLNAQIFDRILIEIIASSQNALLDPRVNTDELVVAEPANIRLLKRSSQECSVPFFPSQEIRYTIDFTNTGDFAPEPATHEINGIELEGVLLTDPVPVHTSLVSSQSPAVSVDTGKAVVQTDNSGEWIDFSAWNGVDPVTNIGVFLRADELSPQASGSVAFSVLINPALDANTVVENVAQIDLDGNGVADFVSNTVCNQVNGLASALEESLTFIEPILSLRQQSAVADFNTPDEFQDTAVYRLDTGDSGYDVVRDGVYLQALLSGIDIGNSMIDAAGRRHVQVSLTSQITGDTLQVTLTATTDLESPGLSTVFRSNEPVRLSQFEQGAGGDCPAAPQPAANLAPDFTASSASCVLQSSANDTLLVGYPRGDIEEPLTDLASVDPSSTVFDSLTLQPVAGAVVSIVESASGAIAKDPVGEQQLVFTTGVDGQFRFPRLLPDVRYSIEVTPPDGYRFPSAREAGEFTDFTVGPFSYGVTGYAGAGGGSFIQPVGAAPPVIDIPLDPDDRDSRLVIDKVALQSVIEPGEIVAYQIEIRNTGDTSFEDVHIKDNLPFGFKYVNSTAEYNGNSIADPRIISGSLLDFGLGVLPPGSSHILNYATLATAGAVDSDGINTAVAVATGDTGQTVMSPQSSARTKIRQSGVLSDLAALFGKVYVDADCNGMHNSGEWPVGGVKVFMQDGTFAVTDENGQYSLYGLKPGRHVLKVDAETLPLGLLLKPLDTRNAADADSRFVDLSRGDFHRADFAASCPQENHEAVFEQIKKRNKHSRGNWLLDEADRFNPFGENPNIDIEEQHTGSDGDLSTGLLNGLASNGDDARKRRDKAAEASAAKTAAKPAKKGRKEMADPAVAIKTVTTQQAKAGTWLWPTDGTSLDGRFMAVIRAGVTPMLLVNGIPVSNEQLGEQIVNKREQAQVLAWYGVKLKPGPNKVEIRGQDPFGNMRILATGEFKRPSMGTRMVLRSKQATLPADGGRSMLPVEVLVLDENDYPAQGVYFVTLENSDGSIFEEDIQDSEPGHQIKLLDGRGRFHIRSSEFTGNIRIRARSNEMSARLDIVQVASARPLTAIGLVELGGMWGDVNGGGIEPGSNGTLPEEGAHLQSRIALFLKGRIKGDMQLTLSYDSDKRGDTDLLRDINPNAHYPIHGDASLRGYEAQSRSKLYAKLERDRHSLMWGDYRTDIDASAHDLARVQRTLTGANGIYDNGNTRIQVFAARPDNNRRVEEIRGNGTAMLFRLSGAPIVANSEIVELVTRNRDNPGLVESITSLTRFGDYILDSVTGEIRFSQVIPFFNEERNPVFIRVSYDQSDATEAYNVAGARLTHAITDEVTLGVSYTYDGQPADGSRLAGAYVEYQPDSNTTAAVAAARMSNRTLGKAGIAHKLLLERQWSERKKMRTSFTYASAGEGFDNRDTSVTAGRREARLTHTQDIGKGFNASAELVHSESLVSDDRRSTAGLTVDKSIGKWILRAGSRRVHQRLNGEQDNYSTLLVGGERKFRIAGRPASASAEYEQDTSNSGRRRMALGAKLQMYKHMRLYGRYEKQRRLNDFTLNPGARSTEDVSVGVESDWFSNTRVYSEMRLRAGIDGRDYETGSGIRGNYEVKPGIKATPGFELIKTHSGDDSSDALAVSLGLTDRRNKNAKSGAHFEYRTTETSQYLGFRVNHAARLNLDWTALLKEELTWQKPDLGEMSLRSVLTVGFSNRPRLQNRHHLLFLYNWKEDLGPDEGADKTTHLFSVHSNFQYHDRLLFSGRAGAKWQTTHLKSGDFESSALLLDGRMSYDIDRRWDIDLRAGLLGTDEGEGLRYSLGAGAYYLVDRNLRLGMGYNFFGFREEDLDDQGYNAHGFHFGLQYKFDEDVFDWLKY